jgi:hypothetical protein
MPNATPILSDRFEVVAEVAVDERNRISLTKALDSLRDLFQNQKDLRFVIQINDIGQILLSPVISVPLHEAWLNRNPVVLAKVRRGLAQAGAGELTDRGSFDKYADDEIE